MAIGQEKPVDLGIPKSGQLRTTLERIVREDHFGRLRSIYKPLDIAGISIFFSRLSAQRECGQAAMCAAAKPRST
jgi:hypothetical protein